MTNYSREKVAEWDSNWRLTGYFRQPVVNEEENSLISQMYWDYAYGVLTPIAVGSVSGAVTNAKNEFFDSAISSDLSGAVTSCEIRASWSPVLVENSADIPGHISAWAELMLRAAGKRVVLRGKKAALQ